MSPVQIYAPDGNVGAAPQALAPPPAHLAGSKFMVLDNGKPGAAQLLAHAAERIAEKVCRTCLDSGFRVIDAGTQLFFNRWIDDESVDDDFELIDLTCVEFELIREVVLFSVDDQPTTSLLPDFREKNVQILSVNLEGRGSEFDFGSLW